MDFIRRYFGLLLLLSCLTGMVAPSFGDASPVIVMTALAFIVFCSYFQTGFSPEVLRSDLALAVRFWALRFLIIPPAVFFLLRPFSPFFALAMLLMLLLPAAVSSPSFSAIFGGKADLSLKILLYSNFLAVCTIPAGMSWLAGPLARVSPLDLLRTLLITIVVPFILHLPLRKVKRVKDLALRYNPLCTLLGLSTIFIVATARNRPAILGNPELVLLYAGLAVSVYALLYALGFVLLPNSTPLEKRTFSISSGANNIGLGVTITAMFFPGNMNILFIVAQLAWVVALVPLRRVFRKIS